MCATESFKRALNQIFDDNLHTKVWHNVWDWIIITLIVISSLEVFLSTFDGVAERYGRVLRFIDVATTIIFSIEISLRIWAADLLSPRYKGFTGRIRYCFSFYGLVDILSTYPAFVGLFVSIPANVLKVFRVARLMRIFRYTKSFQIIGRVIIAKKQELEISFAFLVILTIILSFLLYYTEHDAQPEMYRNAWNTLVWTFAKYLGDPGKIADFPLVTTCGNIIAAIVGMLGIAIFAVPTGLIGSGFIEVIGEMREQKKIAHDTERLYHAFRWNKDIQNTGLFYVPSFVSMGTLLVKQHLQSSEIIEVVKHSQEFHLYNLAKAYNAEDEQPDRIVVVTCPPHNRPYGCCIDRKSNVTIVSTSGAAEPITSWVAYHIAKLGGFNYVAKDEEMDVDNPVSFYTIPNTHANANLEQFLEDIAALTSATNSWVIPMCSCVGPKSRPHKVHLCFNKRPLTDYSGPLCTITDTEAFDRFSQEFSAVMEQTYALPVDRNQYYGVSNENLLHRLPCKNGFALRIEGYVIYFAANRMAKIKAIADLINKHLGTGKELPLPEDMTSRPANCYGYIGYKEYNDK